MPIRYRYLAREIAVLDPRLLLRLTDKKAQLDALRPLPAASLTKLKDLFTVDWIYNSNAIEGSTLTLRETQLILEVGFPHRPNTHVITLIRGGLSFKKVFPNSRAAKQEELL